MSEQHTPGPWERGKPGDSIISKDPATLAAGHQRDSDSVGHLDYYGGVVICESVSPRDRPIIMAAPALLKALRAWSESLYPCPIKTCNCKAGHHLRRLDAEMVRQTRAAIDAAEMGAAK